MLTVPTSQDTMSSQLLVFPLHEASYKDPDLDQLQRSPYLDMPSCPAANGENLYVTGVDKNVYMRPMASPLMRICHRLQEGI